MNIRKQYTNFKQSEHLFICPLCKTKMNFINQNSIVCENKHCFDLSKYGYVNFAPHQSSTKYSKALFESRRNIFQNGLYDPLKNTIQDIIDQHSNVSHNITMLDAGCGEGFFVSNIIRNTLNIQEIFAMDIIKDAIILAAKENPEIKFIVGDIANIPLASNSMDIILNIFSPANYNEFNRLMKDNGILIKVIPNKYYLNELRNCVKEHLHEKEYSNEPVLQIFDKHMVRLDKKDILYTVPVTTEQVQHFVEMTPMMFNINKNDIDTSKIQQITIDVSIIVGKKL